MKNKTIGWMLIRFKIKKLFYRYNIKRKNKDGSKKTVEELLTNLLNVYKRLPAEEQQIMKIHIQDIINSYRKE